MSAILRTRVDALYSADREVQHGAFIELLESTAQPVDWSYEVWDELLNDLSSPDNHMRAIAAQLLCNLARYSDPQKRIMKDFPRLLAVTKDQRFVTARHTLQAIWKVGAAGDAQKQMLLQAMTERYTNCAGEKNYMLIRYDIVAGLKKLYDEIKDEKIRFLALNLIKMEEDPKNHRKNMSLWKNRNKNPQ